MIEQYEEQSDYKNIKISEITKKLEFDIEDYAKELEAEQKCGMKYEGTDIQEVKVKDIYQDVVHYVILRDEWLIR
ncbi:GNAT family N-acetyltransferase [Clostridium sp.]|uniref:GNAT family N-acetyltransferase n=1 Tax=Clostridium sp. TaxID=1506 RepID=UPI0034647F2A